MTESTYLVRIGRVLWWSSWACVAAIALFGGWWLYETYARWGRFEWDDLFKMIALAVAAVLSGRALRYILANE